MSTQPITGYRSLSEEEVALINSIKQKGVEIGLLVEQLEAMESTDKRWVAIGKTDLQTGLMSIIRSIARPSTF